MRTQFAAAEAQEASLRATLDKLVAGPRPDEIAEGRAANTEQTANQLNAQQTYERAAQLRPTGADFSIRP